MNRIQSKNHDIGSYGINISFFFLRLQKDVLKDGYCRLSHFHISTD